MQKPLFLASVVGIALACPVWAVTADEAKALGTSLTLVGAEKAGNKEGTIPEYSGIPLKPPASFDPKKPFQNPSPFQGEKPLFTINAQNYSQYADKLDASAETFKRFANYRMDVFPTHRSYVYPKWVLDNTVKNATSCKATEEELKLENCYPGLPFPIPKTGKQAMWNHLLQYESRTYRTFTDNYVVPTNGPGVLQVYSRTTQNYPFYDPETKTPQPSTSIYWQVRVEDLEPARRTGGGTLVVDSLDMAGIGRRAWSYIPGQRRVKLAPDLSYDTPSPYSGGAATMDDQKGFMGALDRFDFKLVGKKEKFIPYNTYELVDSKACSTEKLISTQNFPNPSCMRWELHRVWVVTATLKQGFRHTYKKRVFHWDEDAPGGGVVEDFDAAGRLYRIINNGLIPLYSTKDGTGGIAGSFFVNLDLLTGIYGVAGVGTCTRPDCGITAIADQPNGFFTPEAMAGEGVR